MVEVEKNKRMTLVRWSKTQKRITKRTFDTTDPIKSRSNKTRPYIYIYTRTHTFFTLSFLSPLIRIVLHLDGADSGGAGGSTAVNARFGSLECSGGGSQSGHGVDEEVGVVVRQTTRHPHTLANLVSRRVILSVFGVEGHYLDYFKRQLPSLVS
ncbi:hypothetical protein GYMLUDRAFT_47025 [Collybiopsis luxurians FD-317 M1]|uniref:Unplaced genomic scaffold GYMLUscaffold_49, whole genome shotgun sequence n=1 Tax=Collybiopsis luxurians FD-317 M1 TaxID=944289 RepID=A0A0D0B0C2_9AGAR|nr:hypothetical protein GYMLUDRAFT_47025 [Collybiopsis luxurians FD-317 M1]